MCCKHPAADVRPPVGLAIRTAGDVVARPPDELRGADARGVDHPPACASRILSQRCNGSRIGAAAGRAPRICVSRLLRWPSKDRFLVLESDLKLIAAGRAMNL